MTIQADKRPVGVRPLEFDQDTADAICERIADGESLRAICKDEAMPSKSTVFKWLGRLPNFADQYERAREAQADSHADDIVDIADDDEIEPNDKRVRIDARKWLAGKLRPKRYGEAVQMKHSGALGVFDPSKLSDDQLAKLEGILGPIAAGAGDAASGEGGEGEAGG